MRTLALIAAALVAFAAHAAPEEPESPEGLDLVRQVERLAAGKPLPIVVVAEGRTAEGRAAPEPGAEGLLPALQDIGAAFSDPAPPATEPALLREEAEQDRVVYQPFAFDTARGRVWTIATDRTWRDKPESTAPPPMPPLVAGQTFFYSLSRAQMEKATRSGLTWRDFSEQQQALLRTMFGQPWAIVRMVAGKERRTPVEVASSQSPLPIEQSVMHLYFGFTYLYVPNADPSDDETYRLFPDDSTLQLSDVDLQWFSDVVPNDTRKMKPSDLDDARAELRHAIGLAGVTTVGDVVKAAAKASALPLMVDARLAERSAFVGDAALPAGDTLKALTFAMDAAWRKVGNVYLLTWDRQGLAARALERRQHETSANSRTAQYTRWMKAARALKSPDWLHMMETVLKPDPAAPVGPTAQQMAEVNAPLTQRERDGLSIPSFAFAATRDREKDVFSFPRLTPDQQNAVRDICRDRAGKDGGAVPMDRLDQSALLRPDVRVVLDTPGVGAVNASLASSSLTYWMDRIATFQKGEKAWEKARDKERQAAVMARPLKIMQPVRAVMPPPLPPGEWPRLLDAMRRKGLNTLYAPVLWDGMTLSPSEQFPQLPICSGQDALAGLLEAAKARNIRVVAVLRTLAWRLPEGASHWLSRHPELVDTDALGRTRRAWWLERGPAEVVDQGLSGAFIRRDPFAVADYVRPDAPEVRSRLLGLISELRRYKGLSGVALANWSRFSAAEPMAVPFGSNDAAPSLGYALNNRTAFLAENSVDPLDIAYSGDPEDVQSRVDMPMRGFDDKWNAFRHAQDRRLVDTLLAAVEAAWPGRAQLFDFLEPSETLPLPAADATITWSPLPGVRGTTYRRVPLSSAPEPPDPNSDAPPPTPELAKAQRLAAYTLALHESALSGRATGIFKSEGVVLDLSAAPDMLWDALNTLPDVGR